MDRRHKKEGRVSLMKLKFIKVITICLVLGILITACSEKNEIKGEESSHVKNSESQESIKDIQNKQDFALNTFISISLYEAPKFNENEWEKTFDILRDIENKMSAHKDDTYVSEINKNAGLKAVEVDKDTFKLIKLAKENAEKTNGAFDPTIGALTKLWMIGTDDERVPSQKEIDSALKKVNYKKLILNEDDKTVFLEEEGMSIDLGGIAKGYSADLVYQHLLDKGIKKAILDFGGNISLIGQKDAETPWRVGIRKPDRKSPDPIVYASLYASDESVVSSGDYERFFEENGKVYHHIINPFTGYPSDNEIRGASVILKSSMEADALATALIVMGRDEAIKFIEENDLEACLVFKDMSSYNNFHEDRTFKLE